MARILLIEPDLILAEITTEYLKSSNHEVDWHSDAQSAITGADASRPELVILELQLGGHSGIEFLYEFRSYPEWQEVPVIIYSSVDSADVESSGILFGPLNISDYLHKHTAGFGELGNSISSALSLKKA